MRRDKKRGAGGMKIQKALNDLKQQVDKWEKGIDFEYYLPPLKVAIKALEKQIPKKLKTYNTFERHCECGAIVKSYCKYCCECGQALDWSDSE